MRNFFVLASISVLVLSLFGCSSDEDQTEAENPVVIDGASAFSGAPLLGDIILENMYEDEARQLADKTPVQIITVIEGTDRVVLNARFRGIRDFGRGYPIYEFELVDEVAEAMGGIAQGMSGSPVGPPGRIMGALAFGDAFTRAPRRFWVTPIDAMEAAIYHQTFGELLEAEPAPAAPAGGIQAAYTPVKTPLMITGIHPHRLEQLSSYLEGANFNFLQLFADIGGAPAAPTTVPTRLAAGDMIGVAVSTGDVVNSIGFGTVTQVYDDGTFVAFGHPMTLAGKSALPVYRAITNGIVSNLQLPYKSVAAYGNPIGTITKDLTPGLVGELGTVPSMIPVKIKYQAGNGPVVEKNHEVAYGQESFIPVVAALTMDSIRQETSSATVDGTITFKFKETATVYTEPFRVASSDPFFDVLLNVDWSVRAFTNRFSNSAGQATLTDVSIAIRDKPQIMVAELQEIIVPEAEILPGEDLTVSVVLLPHWSAAGAERTIRREVTLQVPEDFPAGEALLTVTTANSFGFGDLFGTIGPSFGGDFPFDDFDEEPKPLPENLNELIEKMEDEQIDPSLIKIKLESWGAPPSIFPEDFFPPEDLPFPEEGEIPLDEEIPEDFPVLDDSFPFEPDFEEPPSVEITINIDGFIVVGSKEESVTIAGEEVVDGMFPE